MNFIAKLYPKKTSSYPRVTISSYSKSIYFMTDETTGVKLLQGDTGRNSHIAVGTHSTNWTRGDMVDYEGKVTLDCASV